MGKVIDIRARGKLLLTGEYLVLAGARALAMPVKFGQSMQVETHSGGELIWSSREMGEIWFTARFNPETLEVLEASLPEIAASLSRLLKAATTLNPETCRIISSKAVTVGADYPLRWGLGSSSSLTYLVARWLEVDPYQLFRRVSDGSGYDIACAGSSTPLFYTLKGGEPLVEPATPGSALRDFACFAYLGNKQESSGEVASFRRNSRYTDNDLRTITDIGSGICAASTATELINLVNRHEACLGQILGRDTVASRFKGFPGAVKSLGAWGGDFGMFVSDAGFHAVKTELMKHDIGDVFTFEELIARH